MAPTSTVGRWCAAFGSVFLAAIAVELAVATRQPAGEPDNGWVRGLALAALGSVVAGLVTGLIALARHHDRSVMVLSVVTVGTLVTLFEVVELVTAQ